MSRKADEAVVIDPRTGLPVYGLDQELLLKQQAKYDPEKEAQVRQWIEDVVGEKFSSADFQESLKDGVLLCKLANTLAPGSVAKINSSKLAFMQMENIDKFLKAVEKFGVKKSDQFRSVDLYEAKNMVAVVDTLFIVASVAQKLPNYNGPKVGIKIAEKKQYTFSEEQLLKARAAPSALNEGGMKIEQKKSIGREVVKTADSGDKRFIAALSVASEKQDVKKSIKYDVVKSASAGERGAVSQQFQPAEKQQSQHSISNNIVKVQPQAQQAQPQHHAAPVQKAAPVVQKQPEPEPEPEPAPVEQPAAVEEQPADDTQYIEVPADVAEELEQLAELVQGGIITEDEYEQKRMEILAQFMPQQ